MESLGFRRVSESSKSAAGLQMQENPGSQNGENVAATGASHVHAWDLQPAKGSPPPPPPLFRPHHAADSDPP